MKSGSLECLKYLMFFFNLLFFICGAATLGVGIWAVVSAGSFKQILVDNDILFNGVYIVIAVGAALFLMGFLGCCGAIKESRCLLAMFFVFVLIIFIVEIVGAILVFVYFPKIESEALNSISAYGHSNTTSVAITKGWDTFQSTVACCGYTSYGNWVNNTLWIRQNATDVVPTSCCTRDFSTASTSIINVNECRKGNPQFINLSGCKSKLSNYIWVVGGVGIGILVFEILGMIFACCLYRAVEE